MKSYPSATRRLMLAAASLLLCSASWAQGTDVSDWPKRPVKLVVPSGTGGAMDHFARLVAHKLGDELGQSIVVDNRGGAGGLVAAEVVANAAPDGYTLLVIPNGVYGVAPALYKSLRFDPIKDFAPITNGVSLVNVLVVHPSVPATSLRELVALMKQKPNGLNYGSAGIASSGHLAAELMTSRAGVQATHLAYKGSGPAVQDLVAGNLHFMFATAPSVLPLIAAGKLRALAVTSPARFPTLAQVPTVSEAGISGFEASNWYSFVAPAGTPKAIVAKLNAKLGQLLKGPDLAPQLLREGMTPVPGTPEELVQFMRTDLAKWKEVVTRSNIKAE